MKTKLLLMLLVALALVAGTAQANMLLNPSFEDGTFKENNPPDNWMISEGSGTSAMTWFDDAAGAHLGSRYIKVNTWTGWLGTSGFVWQTVQVTPGQEYAFSVWAKCPFLGETSEAWAWVDWLDSASEIISDGWLPCSLDVGSNWTYVEFGTVMAPLSAARATFWLAGVPENVLMGILFDDACMDTPLPSFSSPAWEAKVAIGDVDLSWTNMAPDVGDSVWVDVLFGTEPNETQPAYDMVKIVDAIENVDSATVEDLTEGTYYWQVDSYIYGDPADVDYSHTDPNLLPIIKGLAWSFDVVADAPPSSVDVGVDMITWSGEPVNLGATIVDDGQSPLTYAWSSDARFGTDVLFSATDIEDPTVTITKISSSNAAIVNPSFEDRLNGWDILGAGHGTWTGIWGGKTHIYPTDGDMCAFVDGTQASDPVEDEGGWLSQTLAETLATDTTYTLTVDVVNDGFYNEDVEYKVQLLAGETVIAEDDDSYPLDLGSGSSSSDWETSTVVYTLGDASDPNFVHVGEPLGIRLVTKVGTLEMNFDNVQLAADPPFPIPELTTIELTAMVTDKTNPTYVLKDTMTVDVYNDACTAAKAAGLAAENPGDFDEDCDTDFADLAELALKWLNDTSLTESALRP